MTAISFNPADMGTEFGKFRDKSQAAENAATPLARVVLAGLLTGSATETSVTLAALAAYNHPKSPTGKVADSLSGLRYASGGDAARKTLESVFKIAKDCGLSPAIREVVVSFVLKSEGCAKSLKALADIVKGHVKALNESQGAQPQASEGQASEGQASEGQASEAPPARPNLADMANQLALAIEAATDEEITAALSAFEALAPYIGVSLEVMREAA